MRLVPVSAFLLSSQCLYLERKVREEAGYGPAPPFQVIERNTLRTRLDVWHPLRLSLARDSNNKVRNRNLQDEIKKPAAQRRVGSHGFHHLKREPLHHIFSQHGQHQDDWLRLLAGALQSLLAPLLSLLRSFSLDSGLLSQGAEDRQSLVETAQVRQ